MKLSNKILIGFALALILIPLTGMIYISRVYYKEGKYIIRSNNDNSIKQLDIPTNGYFKKDLTTFNKISIADGKSLYLQLSIVNGNKYGVKIPNDFKDAISTVIDENGVLQIKFDDKLDRSANSGYGVIIMVYCPKIDGIDISKLGSLTFNAQLDSLYIKSTKTGNINFGSLITYHNNIGERYNNSVVKNLNLELYETYFQSQNNSFNNLNITAAKNSEVIIEGDEKQKDKFNINMLNLNTTGNATIKIENIKVINSTANISDSTKIDVPTYMLKQMFKK